jgi:hypothetical protein
LHRFELQAVAGVLTVSFLDEEDIRVFESPMGHSVAERGKRVLGKPY